MSHEGLALDLFGSRVTHSLQMHEAQVQGQLKLDRAQISATLDLHGTFDGGSRAAINANGCTLQGGLYLRKGFNAKGLVRFSKAQIKDNVMLEGRFEASGQAITFDGATIDGSLKLAQIEVFGECG